MLNTYHNEYETVRRYCSEHELSRPKTDIFTAVKWFVVLEALVCLVTISICFVLGRWCNIRFYFVNVYFLSSIAVFLLFLKKICIIAVELYQHYASDKVRRRCTLMPSCSEYALLALQKYNVFVALYKIYVRAAKKCCGQYETDYP